MADLLSASTAIFSYCVPINFVDFDFYLFILDAVALVVVADLQMKNERGNNGCACACVCVSIPSDFWAANRLTRSWCHAHGTHIFYYTFGSYRLWKRRCVESTCFWFSKLLSSECTMERTSATQTICDQWKSTNILMEHTLWRSTNRDAETHRQRTKKN